LEVGWGTQNTEKQKRETMKRKPVRKTLHYRICESNHSESVAGARDAIQFGLYLNSVFIGKFT